MAKTIKLILKLDADKALSDVDKLGDGLEDLDRASLRGLKGQIDTLSSAVGSFTGNLIADAVSSITQKAIEGGKYLLDYKSNLEQTSIGFTTLLNSGEKAKQLLKEIQDFSKSTPFEFAGIAELAQRILGANVESQKIIPLLRDIGNIVAATGKASQERLEGVTVAITQMISKQKVSAEEMEQLAERGVNGFQILADATGLPQAELRKLAEQGKLSSDIMIAALQKVSKEKFGDAMAKQSKTFSGATANLIDSLTITTAKSLEGVYSEISNFAVRFSAEVDAQGDDLKAIGNVIAQYVGEGLALGFSAVVEVTAKAVTVRFVNFFTNAEFVDPIASALQKGIGVGVARAFGASPEFITGFKKGFDDVTNIGETLGEKVLPNVAPKLKELLETTKKLSETTDKTPNLAEKLKADKASADAEKLYKTLRQTLRDLTLQIRFFGDETQVAATKQQLIKQGVTDFNSGLAKVIISEAAHLDELKEKKKAQDDFNNKFKAFADEIEQVRKDAEFELEFVNPTELDKFNRKVKESGLEFKGLKAEIEQTRNVLRLLAIDKEYNKAGDVTKQLLNSIKEATSELNNTDISPFQSKINELLKNIELFTVAGEKLDNAGVANQIELRISKFQRDLGSLNDWASNAIGNPEEIQNALKTKTETIINDWYADFIKFMRTIRQKVEANGQVNFVSLFEGDTGGVEGLKETAESLIRLFNEFFFSDLGKAKENYNNVITDLDEEIQQLNVDLGLSAELSKADATAKMLQADAYKNLTPEMKATIQAKAEEIDRLKAAKDAQDEYRRAFEQTADVFEDALTRLSDGDWKGFFDGILQEMKRFLVRAAAEWLTSKFFKLISGQNGSSSGSSGGGIFDIFKGIFGSGSASSSSGGSGGLFGIIKNFIRPGSSSSGALSSVGGIQNTLVTPDGKTFSAGNGKLGLAGGLAIAGTAANIIGGLIGGRAGGFISNIGTGVALGAQIGSIVPGLGTAIGAGIGAIAGGLMSLFGGDPKRKRDKNEKLPQLQQGFADALNQLRQLGANKDALFNDPEGTIAKAMELRAQIAAGFGIQMESKKYQGEARKLIDTKLSEADSIIADLNKLKDRAILARDVDTRLKTRFATGAYISPEFAAQYGDFKRRNGMLAGRFTGKDYLPSLLADGEMVLNEQQIEKVKANAGFDAFHNAGIPGYAKGSYIQPSTTPSPTINIGSPNTEKQPIIIQLTVNNTGMVETDVTSQIIDSLKTNTNVRVEVVKAYDKEKLRTN